MPHTGYLAFLLWLIFGLIAPMALVAGGNARIQGPIVLMAAMSLGVVSVMLLENLRVGYYARFGFQLYDLLRIVAFCYLSIGLGLAGRAIALRYKEERAGR